MHRFEPSSHHDLVELLRVRGAARAEQLILAFDDGDGDVVEITYGELDRRARAVAATLQRAGVAPGDRLLLLYPPGPDFVAGFFGCLYAGAIAVPAYPPDPSRLARTLPRLEAIAVDCAPAAALTTAPIVAVREAILTGKGPLDAVPWLATDAYADGAESAWRAPPALGDRPALLQYTSGTTREPKGVVLTHENLLHNSESIRSAFGVREGDAGVIWLPPYHDMGLIGGVLQPIYAELPTLLMSPLAFLRRPMRWLEAIARRRGTISGGPNFAYELCIAKSTKEERARLDLSSWAVAFTGAEPVRASTLDRFVEAFGASGFRRSAIYPCYGLAESTLIVTGGRRGDPPVVRRVDPAAMERLDAIDVPVTDEPSAIDASNARGAARSLVGCGAPLLQQRVAIVDPELRVEVANDRLGEIWTTGPSVGQGYFQREEESRAAFGARLADGRGPYLRTGDLGFMRDGALFVAGRIKDLVIVRGRNHHPHDIELTAERASPAIRAGCGAAFSVGCGEERLVVVYEIDPTKVDPSRDVAADVRDAVMREHELAVDDVVLVRARTIPKTSSGKIQRFMCRRAYLDGALARERLNAPASTTDDGPVPAAARITGDEVRALPSDARAARVVALLRNEAARIAGVAPRAAADAPVTSLGLDSLGAVELAAYVERELGASLVPSRFLDDGALADLARDVAAAVSKPRPTDVSPATERAGLVSVGQAALWYEAQVNPRADAYVIASGIRVHGEIEPGVLRRAFQIVVDRHDMLRSTFVLGALAIERRIAPAGTPVAFDAIDARALSEDDLRARVEAYARAPIDVVHGPVFRAALFTRTTASHVLVVAAHHLAVDLWSVVALVDELRTALVALRAGRAVDLPAPRRDYEAFARWQADLLVSPAGIAASAAWARRLAGAERLVLAADRADDVAAAPAGHHAFAIDDEHAGEIHAFARREGATPFMVCFAAFAALLARHADRSDVAIGAPFAGRPPGFDGVVGYFVSLAVLRVDLGGSPSFRDLVARSRRAVLDALERQHVPPSASFAPSRGGARPPLVDCVLAYEKSQLRGHVDHVARTKHADRDGNDVVGLVLGEPGARADIGGLACSAEPIRARTTAFSLTLTMLERGPRLTASFQYDATRFDAEAVERLASRFGALFRECIARPEEPLERLPFVTREERDVLSRWATGPVLDVADVPVHAAIAAHAARSPDAIAVVAEDGRLTYTELDRRSNQLARYLIQRGARRGDVVAVQIDRSTALPMALLAVWKAGAAYVPIDPAYPIERTRFVVSDARPLLRVTLERHLSAELGDPSTIVIDRIATELGAISDRPLPVTVTARDAAYVIYTSGSSGTPKGAVCTHGAVSNLLRDVERRAPLTRGASLGEGPRCSAWTSPSFDVSVYEIFGPLAAGAAVWFVPSETRKSGAAFGRWLAESKIVSAYVPPFFVRDLADEASSFDEASGRPRLALTRLLVGVEPIASAWTAAIARALPGLHILNGYGPTECTVMATCHEVDRDQVRGVVPIGRPMSNLRAYVVRGDARDLAPAGAIGEVYLGGVGLADGYRLRPEWTAAAFVPDPFSGVAGARLYRTGDMARWLPGRALEFVGRRDRQTKVRGVRIEPIEIEAAIAAHPSVRDVVVAVRPWATTAPIVAYVVLADGAPFDPSSLLRHAQAMVPAQLVPSAFVRIGALPTLPSGKIDRAALPEPFDLRDRAYVAPRTSLERDLAVTFATLLDVPVSRVGALDDFFELGGHSLLVPRLAAAVARAHGVEIALRDFVGAPTVERLAEAIVEAQASRIGADELARLFEEAGALDAPAPAGSDDANAPAPPAPAGSDDANAPARSGTRDG